MARPTAATARTEKEPGRLKQMWQVFRMTIRHDSLALTLLIAVFVAPVLVGILIGVIWGGGPIGLILYILTGVLAGVLLFLIVLGRRAEKAAYSQIEGQPGAVSAVIQNSLRGGWTGDAMPVAVNPKTQDAVYRVVGRGGVALVAEGPTTRTQRLVDEQRRTVNRIVPNVAVTVIHVGPDAGSTPLHRIPGTLRGIKRQLRKAEVRQIANRLESLNRGANLPIPKGIDPTKIRAPRPR